MSALAKTNQAGRWAIRNLIFQLRDGVQAKLRHAVVTVWHVGMSVSAHKQPRVFARDMPALAEADEQNIEFYKSVFLSD